MDYQGAIEYFERRMELKEKEVPSENQYIKQADDTLREIYKTTISGMQELQALHEQGINLKRLKDIDFRKEVIEHINYMEYMSVKDELEEYKQLGTLEEVREAVETIKRYETQYPDDMRNLLEPLKVSSALKSEIMKLEFRKQSKPESISVLDYTIIAALKKALEEVCGEEE